MSLGFLVSSNSGCRAEARDGDLEVPGGGACGGVPQKPRRDSRGFKILPHPAGSVAIGTSSPLTVGKELRGSLLVWHAISAARVQPLHSLGGQDSRDPFEDGGNLGLGNAQPLAA